MKKFAQHNTSSLAALGLAVIECTAAALISAKSGKKFGWSQIWPDFLLKGADSILARTWTKIQYIPFLCMVLFISRYIN